MSGVPSKYKLIVMLGRLDHGSPLVYLTEFDSQKAALAAAAWLHANGGFQTTVIPDPEWDEEAEKEEEEEDGFPEAAWPATATSGGPTEPAPEVAA